MNLVEWSKNADYPMSFTTCRECGTEGVMKQAWDRRGSLCLDAKACLNRMTQNRPSMMETINSVMDEVCRDRPDHDGAADEQTTKVAKAHPIQRPATTEGIQQLVCRECNSIWERPSSRGRPPVVCNDCRS